MRKKKIETVSETPVEKPIDYLFTEDEVKELCSELLNNDKDAQVEFALKHMGETPLNKYMKMHCTLASMSTGLAQTLGKLLLHGHLISEQTLRVIRCIVFLDEIRFHSNYNTTWYSYSGNCDKETYKRRAEKLVTKILQGVIYMPVNIQDSQMTSRENNALDK